MKPATACIHGGVAAAPGGGVNSTIEPSAAFAYLDADEPPYPRYFNTPGQRTLASRLCALEHAEEALLFASGMAAITSVLFGQLRAGDHAVLQRDLYGGTHTLVTREFARHGIGYTLTAPHADAMRAALRPETRLLYIETPSNPLLRVVDIAAVATLARESGLVSVIDNTFASPVNQNPLDLGIDLVVHSGTKYLGGHSDLCCGVALGGAAHMAPVREAARLLGGSVNPLTVYLLERSLKTLAVRVARQNANAQALAGRLAALDGVARVHYPGLPDHPDHAVAARQMRGFGGMLSFELAADAVDAVTFQRRLRLVRPAVSLGGVESLICAPVLTSHARLDAGERAAQGIGERLLRLSVGIEEVDDLYDDLAAALRG